MRVVATSGHVRSRSVRGAFGDEHVDPVKVVLHVEDTEVEAGRQSGRAVAVDRAKVEPAHKSAPDGMGNLGMGCRSMGC